MKSRLSVFTIVIALMALFLVACGGSPPATLGDIPTYPDAKLLKPGENAMADTLAKNVQQAGAMGAKLDQQMYSLPKDTSWDKVKQFYGDKLGGSGWQTTNMPVPGNNMMNLSVWTRSGQSLTVAQINDPTSSDSFLLFSLASQ